MSVVNGLSLHPPTHTHMQVVSFDAETVTFDLEGECGKSFDRLLEGVSVGDIVECCVVGVDVKTETATVVTTFENRNTGNKKAAKYKTNMAVSATVALH